jgi:hypothetical protein
LAIEANLDPDIVLDELRDWAAAEGRPQTDWSARYRITVRMIGARRTPGHRQVNPAQQAKAVWLADSLAHLEAVGRIPPGRYHLPESEAAYLPEDYYRRRAGGAP